MSKKYCLVVFIFLLSMGLSACVGNEQQASNVEPERKSYDHDHASNENQRQAFSVAPDQESHDPETDSDEDEEQICTHACEEGERRCTTDGEVETCISVDGCRVWDDPVECFSPAAVCSGGQCILGCLGE